jgi:DNA replication protein DnaC
MNNTATIEKMQSMKLHGMARAFRESHEVGMKNEITPDEMLAFLIDAEWDERYNRKLARRLSAARFRYQARIEEVSTAAGRNIDKNKLIRFTDAGWIGKAENIIITGATGVGKSFIASAIGHHACHNGFDVLYFNCLKLFSNLKISKADGTYAKEIKKIKSQDLIILDDFGLSPFDKDSRLMLLEIIEDRIGISSTIVSTQLPLKQWFDVIGDQTIADAFIDRLIHSSHKINLKGESMRKNSGNFLPLD